KAESSVERLSFLFLRLKRTPSRKVRVFFCVGYISPVALCLPGLRTLRVLLPGPVHHITTVSAPQYYCLCNQASLPPPDTVN
ncbi:hypothetical protein N5J21_27775, partial [Klebsiella quasipneumoniae]|uniref:hypothetical protein n=1 Tax=Klebsiella quasipneumoniae TaxID=1463165 RepID=UPI00244A76B7